MELLNFPNYKFNDTIRVAAYCRVSSDSEDQINSFNNQKQYYNELFLKYKNVTFIDLFADEGISGTSTLKRLDFNRMIKDAEDNKFDLIYTKEVSRFARNTIDTLKYTRKLKEFGVGVYFETDNIFTLDNDGELRLTIMATLAQEESRKISMRTKWGLKQAMKKGIVFGNDKILGLNIVDKKITINEQEAIYIKNIFQWVKEGKSIMGIIKQLKIDGLKCGKLGGKLTHTSLKQMLRNEKYCGDLIQHKNITEDYLTHKKTKNENKDSFVIIRNNHPVIIDRKTWNEVQLILDAKEEKFKNGIGYSKYVWGGKIICNCCGGIYRRTSYKNPNGKRHYIWKCRTSSEEGKTVCSNTRYIREDILEKILMDIFKNIISNDDKNEVLQNLINILEKNIQNSNVSQEIETVKKQLNQILIKKSKLLDLYMDDNSTLTKENYNIKNEEYINIENELKNTLNELENMNQLVENKKNKLEKFYFIIKKKIEFTDFNKDLIEEFLEKIVVNENKLLKIFLINDKYEVDLSNKYDEKIILNHHERQVSLPNRINLYNIMSYNGNNYDIEIYLYA